MTVIWDCVTNSWRAIYTKAEVLAHGWKWHAGTKPIIVAIGCLGLTGAAPMPPQPWHPVGGLVPVPAVERALGPNMDWPDVSQFLPPTNFGVPFVPEFGPAFSVSPGLVAEETAPSSSSVHPCQPGHQWNWMTKTCVEGPVPSPVSTPEPSTLAVAMIGLAMLWVARWRRAG
jgi:hypothetical protein